MIKKIALCFASLLLLFTCTACEASASYLVKDYLNDLAIKSGIADSNDIKDNFLALEKWGVVDKKDSELFDDVLKYDFLSKSICNLIETDKNDLDTLKSFGWIDTRYKSNDKVSKKIGQSIIEKAVYYINNRTFDSVYKTEYRKNIKTIQDDLQVGDIVLLNDQYYKLVDVLEGENKYEEANFDDVFSYLDISTEFEIDFSKSEVIPYNNEETNNIYQNNKYTLLSSNTQVFNTDGYRISYSLNSSGIHVHVSKEVESFNVYLDLDINNVKPTFKWKYEQDDVKNCYFNIKMNSSEKLGISDGKYGNYYLNFKDLDSSSFKSLLTSMIDPKKDQVEASIPICKIKTPIPNIPTAYLNLDLLIKLYASGKAELSLYNSHNMGFETKDGNIRFINEHTNNFDSIAQASCKAGFGANLALEAATFVLADVEMDAGLKAKLQATMHLYDDEGDFESVSSNIEYSTLNEISRENNDVKICGDVSFYWYMDLLINTSKTKMSKYGFSRSYSILDEDNQVFGNLHHIENGHFVDSCTRKKKASIKTMQKVKSERIVLDSYAEVLKINDSYQIIIKSLPDGYKIEDIIYSSSNSNAAAVINGNVLALSAGNAQIEVKTSDNKYKSYVNILVSTG